MQQVIYFATPQLLLLAALASDGTLQRMTSSDLAMAVFGVFGGWIMGRCP